MAKIFGKHVKSAQTDWKNDLTFTPSGFGTPGNGPFIFYQRVGDTMKVRGYFQSGTLDASIAYIALPGGINFDPTKYTAGASNSNIVGRWASLASASTALASNNRWSPMFIHQPNPGQIYFANKGSSDIFEVANGNTLGNNGDGFAFEFEFAVTGWSANDILRISDDSKV